MAYNKRAKSYAIKRAVFVLAGILCVLLILFAVFSLYRNMLQDESASSPANKAFAVKSNTVPVAAAKQSMVQGELLDTSNTEIASVPAELVPKEAITNISELKDMRLKHEVSEKALLTKADLMPEWVLPEEDDRLIEHNFAEGAIPAAVAEGSFIDIKLFVKGDGDKVVISKTMVISRDASLLSFHMNAREQELLKESATEGLLIAVKYIDVTQPPSEVTYVPEYEKGKEK